VKPRDLREQLLALSQQNRHYDFLQTALPYIEQVPADDGVRLQALRSLAQLGLFGPAVELVDDRPDLLNLAPDLADSVAVLRQQPSSLLSWSDLSATFEQNLALACKRFESCRKLEQDIRTGTAGLNLYRCNDGNFVLSRRVDQTPRQWLPGFIDWVGLVARTELLPQDTNVVCAPYLIEGIAFGHVLRKIHQGTAKMFLTYTPLIHVMEPNVAQFAAWLHLGDHSDILGDERFHLWLGEGCVGEFVDFHRARPMQMAPCDPICQPRWGSSDESVAADALERVHEEQSRCAKESRQAILAGLANQRSADHYANRFKGRDKHPLRILGVTSRYTTFLQYSMRDIQQAAIEQGHDFQILIESNDHEPTLPEHYILNQIETATLDLIIILDHNRKEFGQRYDLPIPYCNWIQDDLPNLFGPNCGRGLDPYDLVVGTIGNWKARAAGYTKKQWLNLPTPVSVRTFSNEPVSDADMAEYECDVSFASHLHKTRDELLNEALSLVTKPELRRLIEVQYETFGPRIAAGDMPGSPVQTIAQIQQLAEELGFRIGSADADQFRRIFTDRLINSHFREQILEWISDMGLDLHIYGRGWDRHPTLAKHARGPAEHGAQLRAIYQASRINLQAVPTGATHQRLLEGLSSGGFFLIRRTPTDSCGVLNDSIVRRCVAMGIQSEDDLWNTSDAELARDVRTLNEALYAPSRLYDGFAADCRVALERGFSLQADALLPRYPDVAFATRDEFEELAARFLSDEQARRDIVAAQREVVVKYFSYDALVERVLAFAERRFADLASCEKRQADAREAALVSDA
jgi:hypothetical protein